MDGFIYHLFWHKACRFFLYRGRLRIYLPFSKITNQNTNLTKKSLQKYINGLKGTLMIEVKPYVHGEYEPGIPAVMESLQATLHAA